MRAAQAKGNSEAIKFTYKLWYRLQLIFIGKECDHGCTGSIYSKLNDVKHSYWWKL